MSIKTKKSKKVALLFGEDGITSPAILGGKGAGLTELAQLDVPVPPGFTVTTSVARAFSQHGCTPHRLQWQLDRGIKALEHQTGKLFGDPRNPMLVSVRSGAAVSMPGMMDTILNLGLNQTTVEGLGKVAGDRFAWDSYRRFLSMFGDVVLGVSRQRFEEILTVVKSSHGAMCDHELDVVALQKVCRRYRDLIEMTTDLAMIDDPRQQLEQALVAVLKSWDNPRAQAYRQTQGIPENLGTAVNIQSMVYGNRDMASCSGVVFSRNVSTGVSGLWGEFLVNAQGEDVVAGTRTPTPILAMASWNKAAYEKLKSIVEMLEEKRARVVDVEFTVEAGQLHILQVRDAKLAPEAAITVATNFVWEKKLDKGGALAAVTRQQLQAIQAEGFQSEALALAIQNRLLARGISASPGSVCGHVVLTSQAAVDAAAAGRKVILFRPDTSPDDLPGMLAAAAVVTTTGGATSHAAVVARSLGKTAVVGCKGLNLSAGHVVSVDGQSAVVIDGEVETSPTLAKKEVNIFLRWVAQAVSQNLVRPRLDFRAVKESVSFHRLLNDFYLSEHMARSTVGSMLEVEAALLKKRVHTLVAERVVVYLVVAVGGEIRWANQITTCNLQVKALVTEFEIQLGGDRGDAQKEAIETLKNMSMAKHIRFLELVAYVFDRGDWSGSYGGMAWGRIARAALSFLQGKISHSVLADHAFDLQHNNGTVFGKNAMLTGDRNSLQVQLEAKKWATDISDLRVRLRDVRDEWSADVSAMYSKGVRLGLWY